MTEEGVWLTLSLLLVPLCYQSCLGRALYFSTQVPRGPALVALPFDLLMLPPPAHPLALPPAGPALTCPVADIEAVAALLASSSCPVLITEHGGASDKGRAALRALVDALAMPLWEWWLPATLNLSRAHPLHGRGAVEVSSKRYAHIRLPGWLGVQLA